MEATQAELEKLLGTEWSNCPRCHSAGALGSTGTPRSVEESVGYDWYCSNAECDFQFVEWFKRHEIASHDHSAAVEVA